MRASSIPYKFATPWAADATTGYITAAIPVTTASPAASQQLGFPPATASPIGAGGTPPNIADINGGLNYETSWTQWIQAGGPIGYDATFSTNIGGYPNGAKITAAYGNGWSWLSIVDNNTSDPDTGGSNWVGYSTQTGIIGDARNLKADLNAAGTSVTFTADEGTFGSTLGSGTYKLGSLSNTLNIATTGAGGMDTGSAPTSGIIGVYWILNPSTGATALLGTNGAGLLPPIYGGANMPTGYTQSWLVSVLKTNSSAQLFRFFQRGRTIYCPAFQAFATGAATASPTACTGFAGVPYNAVQIGALIEFTCSTSGATFTSSISPCSDGSTGAALFYGGSIANAQVLISPPAILGVQTQNTFYYTAQVSLGVLNLTIVVTSYTI